VNLRVFGINASLYTLIYFALAIAGVGTAYFGETRFVMASGVIVAYLAMCVGVSCARRRRSRQITSITTHSESDATAILIAYASQTGFAEKLAVQTAQLLDAAGQVVHLESLDALGSHTFARYRRVLFIVSTTGEGDAQTMPQASCAR
jgi:sulfite reductase (NADPH) flavoprotein alpha-component